MRPLMTGLLIIALLGGIFAYSRFAESVKPEPPVFMMKRATGVYTVRVTRTFDCVGNVDFGIPALKILFKKQVVYSRNDDLAASEIVTIPPLIDVEQGDNEIFVEANAKSDLEFEQFAEDSDPRGPDDTPLVMRIEILRDGNVIAESSIWNEPGIELVVGTIGFTVDKLENRDEHRDH